MWGRGGGVWGPILNDNLAVGEFHKLRISTDILTDISFVDEHVDFTAHRKRLHFMISRFDEMSNPCFSIAQPPCLSKWTHTIYNNMKMEQSYHHFFEMSTNQFSNNTESNVPCCLKTSN